MRYDASDANLLDVDLRGNVVRVTVKGRREMVLPIGKKTARDIDRYLRVRAAHAHAEDPWLWLGARGRLTARCRGRGLHGRTASGVLPRR